MISTSGFLRTLGRSNRGRVRLPSMRTTLPSSVRSTASTTRSICCTPTTLTSSSPLIFRSACGTQPATMTGTLRSFAWFTKFMNAACDGSFTVQLFSSHSCASSLFSVNL